MDATVAPSTRANLMQQRRTRWLLIVTASCVVIGLAAAAYWWLYARHYETTDDAYVAGDLVNVSSQVSGTVVAIDADETDFVQTGQDLIKLDDTDARIALEEAEQQLAKVVRQVRTVFTSRDELSAGLVSLWDGLTGDVRPAPVTYRIHLVHLDGREEPRELTSLSGSYSVGDLIPASAGECWQVVSVRPEDDGLTGLMCDPC